MLGRNVQPSFSWQHRLLRHAPLPQRRALYTRLRFGSRTSAACRSFRDFGSASDGFTPQNLYFYASDAAKALQECIGHFQRRDLAAVVGYLTEMNNSNTPLEVPAEPARSPQPVSVDDRLRRVCEHILQLDTFAIRNLVYNAPVKAEVVSSLQVSDDTYMQRTFVVSPSGEECVLTFRMTLQCLRAGTVTTQQWKLESVTGESQYDELPSHPSPSFPPESVVASQLQALRDANLTRVFAFASPEHKTACGSLATFMSAFSTGCYKPLMGHVAAQCVQRSHPHPASYVQLVEVQAFNAEEGQVQPSFFVFVLSRQPSDSAFAGCWMVDSIQPAPQAVL